MSEKVTLDRAACCWRGYHIPTVGKALRTGEPAFKFREYDTKCPVCGVLFKRTSNNMKGHCSHSCGMKGGWSRRREGRKEKE